MFVFSQCITANLQVEGQAVPQSFVLLGEAVGEKHPVYDLEQQRLSFGRGQQGAPVFHYAAWITQKHKFSFSQLL